MYEIKKYMNKNSIKFAQKGASLLGEKKGQKMKVLVLNCGSSSLKYQLIDMDTEEVMAKGTYERIGEQSFVTHKVNGEKFRFEHPVKTHKEAIDFMTELLLDPKYNTIKSLAEIDGIGHRVAQGADKFSSSVIIDEDVIAKIDECAALAPVHNKAAITGIRAAMEAMPGKPNVAVFDTVFHQTIPEERYTYPIPYKYYEKYGIRKYGFHGTSHKYVSVRIAELLGRPVEELKTVVCHLGQGASLCAVKGGKSVDTTMGLTPLGGIPMCARSGDLDPSIVTYLMKKENLTADEVESILNKKSGLTAVSKLVPDFREIENASNEGNEDAIIAINKFVSTIAQYIARYAAVMEGIDEVVFTGGIGENQFRIRSKICKKLKFMGLDLDEEKNNEFRSEGKISKEGSKVEIWVVPTDEELMIAQDTLDLIK